jgi:enterochelin esterase-like enzyme
MHSFLFTLVASVLLPSSAAAQEKELPKPVQPTLNWTTPAIQADRVQYLTFESIAANSKVSFHVYTPEAYDEAKDRRFPVLYWLHGTGGGLPGIKPLSQFFDEAIRMEKIPPMLVVFPNGLATSMWCDSMDGRMPMETVVVKELVPHVDKTFRTLTDRSGRIIEGFSMGGYGAGRLGFLYADTFGTVSVLAGGPLDLEFQGPRAKRNPAEREQILKGTFGDDLDYFKKQSPLTIAEKHAESVRGRSKVRVVVGERDFSLELNRAYSEHLKKLKVDHVLTVVPGVVHETMPLLKGLGDANWQFYRAAFGKK